MNAIIYTLIVTHITIVCVTVFLHRGQAHRGLEFNPILSHFMRFWLWLTTGMVTKQWVAIHRKHHRYSDQNGDPHSPHVYGIKNIFFRGVYYYYLAAKDAHMVVTYGKGTSKLYCKIEPGSIVVDPWRTFTTDDPTIKVIHYGNTRNNTC